MRPDAQARTVCAALFFVACVGSSAPAIGDDLARLVPDDGAITLYVDISAIQASSTFKRVMDIIEASDPFIAAAGRFDAWGFQPRTDLRAVGLSFVSLETPTEFVAVAVGDLDLDLLEARLSERVRLERGADDHGPVFLDGDLAYAIYPELAIAGTRLQFDRVRARRHGVAELGDAIAWQNTVWLRVRVDESLRRRHPALNSVSELVASITIDDSPRFSLRATTASNAVATESARQLNLALRAVAAIPEVAAFGLTTWLESAQASAEGDQVSLEAQLDAASWARFSQVLEELLAEELR